MRWNHNCTAAAIHPDGDKLLVCDRENNRVQLFSLSGDFIDSWFSHRACGVTVSGGSIYVAELGTHSGVHGFGQWADYSKWTPNIGNVISILGAHRSFQLWPAAGTGHIACCKNPACV